MVAIGEIKQKADGVEWLINDFFSLSIINEAFYVSPFFPFANANWFLEMYPNGSKTHKSEGYISLFLHRTYPGPHILMEYSLGVKTADDKLFPELHVTYDFNSKHGCGFHHFVDRFKIFGRKYDVMYSGKLTVVCKLKPSKITEFASNTFILHKSKVFQDYKELFLSQKDSDVVIKVREKEFPAHRIILSARSPVFESTFRNDMKERRTGIIDIEDCDPSTFSDFLCFLYCGDIEIITVKNVFNLTTAADKYDVSDLRESCLEFLKENLCVDTFCDTITLALDHSLTDLITLTTDYFTRKCLEIVKTVKWQSFLARNPTQCNELLIKALESFKDIQK